MAFTPDQKPANRSPNQDEDEHQCEFKLSRGVKRKAIKTEDTGSGLSPDEILQAPTKRMSTMKNIPPKTQSSNKSTAPLPIVPSRRDANKERDTILQRMANSPLVGVADRQNEMLQKIADLVVQRDLANHTGHLTGSAESLQVAARYTEMIKTLKAALPLREAVAQATQNHKNLAAYPKAQWMARMDAVDWYDRHWPVKQFEDLDLGGFDFQMTFEYLQPRLRGKGDDDYELDEMEIP